jgi:flagellar biosynthetic protein FliP
MTLNQKIRSSACKIFISLIIILSGTTLVAQDLGSLGLPALTSSLDANGESTYSLSLQILVLMTVLTVIPSIILGMTAFTRIIIVLSILRQALGTQQTPPNQVLIAIALFLTFYIMSPIFEVLYQGSINPYLEGVKSAQMAITEGTNLLKDFMIANTRVDTLNQFAEMAGKGPFEDNNSIPLSIVLPSFITSELKTAFEIGFLIFLPFLVIDMVIASILMSLGMMMLSPMLISLPFKLLLFVLVDGWSMTIGSLSATFVVGG